MSRRRQDYAQAENLDVWLRSLIHSFDHRILPIDAAAADAWGQIYAIPNVPIVDGLLAATAKVHGLTLVTRNLSHVQGLGADLLNQRADADYRSGYRSASDVPVISWTRGMMASLTRSTCSKNAWGSMGMDPGGSQRFPP